MSDISAKELELLNIPNNVTPHVYTMDPQTEDLIFGSDIQNDMIVLFEDSLLRGYPTYLEELETGDRARWESEKAKIDENNRWCKVTMLRQAPGSDIIWFIGLYGDGTKRVRRCHQSYGWFVKTNS